MYPKYVTRMQLSKIINKERERVVVNLRKSKCSPGGVSFREIDSLKDKRNN